MWLVWFFGPFLFAVPALADPGFDEKYERDYNIFNPIKQYQPDNPLNPILPHPRPCPLVATLLEYASPARLPCPSRFAPTVATLCNAL